MVCPSVMCGIFGVICSSEGPADRKLARSLAISLLRHSETRGREAAGIAVHDGERIAVLKQGGSVSDFLANPKLHALLDDALARSHARQGDRDHRPLAARDERRAVEHRQQPAGDHARRGRAAQRHRRQRSRDRRAVPGDRAAGRARRSEILAGLLRTKLNESRDLVAAARATFAEIQGSASLAMLFDDLDVMLLATNTGSLFQLVGADGARPVLRVRGGSSCSGCSRTRSCRTPSARATSSSSAPATPSR